MEERVADGFSKAFSPFEELLLVGSIAGDVFLIHATGTHETPFVMVSTKPYLGDILKLTVLIDFLRIDVAVII